MTRRRGPQDPLTPGELAQLQKLREEGQRLLDHDLPLWPAHVAALFRVDPKSVTRWAKAGRLGAFRTPGGHRRYEAAEVRRLLDAAAEEDEAA